MFPFYFSRPPAGLGAFLVWDSLTLEVVEHSGQGYSPWGLTTQDLSSIASDWVRPPPILLPFFIK